MGCPWRRPSRPESDNRYSTEMTQGPLLAQKLPGTSIRGSNYSDGKPRWAIVQDSGVLRVFMSSTFLDMQKERDEFFANAEKKLKEFAKKRGLILVFIDLRWGLTGEVSANGLVVISCLESIEECPYFLCTLGSRYGWSPNHENPSEWHPDTDMKFPYLKEIRGLSVTDYEIVHGVLKENAVARRAFFYSRDEEHAVNYVAVNEAEKALYRPVDERDRENQNTLKKKIGDTFCIKPYKTPKELMDIIVEDLTEAINLDFPEKEDKNPEDMAHEQFMRHRLIGLEGRDEILAVLKEKAKQQLDVDDSDIVIVGAESGIGKSTIMSGLIRDLDFDRESSLVVIYHFVGCSNLSNYVENLVERVARILDQNELIKLNVDSEEGKKGIKKGLDYILRLASKNEQKQVVVIIDAFNQFVDSQEYKHVHHLEWLPKKTPKNISIVASTINTHESCKVAKSFGLDIVPVSKLDDAGIRQAAISFFKRYNKTLSENQLEMILSDNQDTGHPLYLRIVLDELRVFGVYEKVDLELHEMLETDGVVNLFDLVMSRWEKRYGNNIVYLSISVMFVSRIGLDENELGKYMEYRVKQTNMSWDPNIWKSVLFVLLESLFVRNRRYAFSHQLLVQSVKERYFQDESRMTTESRNYGLWLLHEYGTDFEENSVIAEICHQMRVSGEYEKLAGYLKNEKVVENLLKGNYRYEFFECWRDLGKNGFDHKATYGEMAKELTPAGSALVSYFEELKENNFLIPILEHRISIEKNEDSNSTNLNILGWVHSNLHKNDQALEYYHKSLEIRLRIFGGVHSDVANSYNSIGVVYDITGKYDQALEYLHKSLEIQLNLLGETHYNVSNSYGNIGAVFINLGKYDQALEYLHKSLEIQMKVFGEIHPDVSKSYNNIATIYKNLGKTEKALEYFNKSLEIRLRVYGEMHPDVAKSYHNIGVVNNDIEKHDEALLYHRKSLDTRRALFGELNPDVADSYNNIGIAYDNLGNPEKALEYYHKSLEIRLKIFGELHGDVVGSHNNIGRVYLNLGDNEKALKSFQKHLEISIKVFGEIHPDVAISYKNNGLIFMNIGNNERALEYFQRSLEIRLKALGAMDPSVATSYYDIGVVHNNLENYEQALESFQKSLEIRLKVFGDMHLHVAATYHSIANALNDLGNYEQALEYFQKLIEVHLNIYGEIHPIVASSYDDIGVVYISLENYEQALESFQKSLEIRLKVFGEMHSDVAASYSNMANICTDLGNHEQALEYFQKLIEFQLKTFGDADLRVAASYGNIGNAYLNLDNYEQALEYFQKSLDVHMKLFGDADSRVAASYNNIGSVYMSLENYEQALEYFQKSHEIQLKVLGDSHPDIATSFYNMGATYENQERFHEALDMYEKAKEVCQQIYGEGHPNLENIETRISESGNTAVFLFGGETKDVEPIPLFVRDGDVVIMSGPSRLCYHGVPRIMTYSCPSHYEEGDGLDNWDSCLSYIKHNRININARQVLAEGAPWPEKSKSFAPTSGYEPA